MLVIAPHPDDESLAVGGLVQRALARGIDPHIVFATDGENNPWAQRAGERRWRIGPAERERWRTRRRAEARTALACLGVSEAATTFLGHPDQGLTGLLLSGHSGLVRTLREMLRRWRPSLLVAPALEDLHPDHSALAVMTRFALAGLETEARRPRLLQFVVHRRDPCTNSAAASLRLTPEERARKRTAILCHTSQLIWRRRSLLAAAGATERFLTGAAVGEGSQHPVHGAFLRDGRFHLELAPRSRLGAFGPIDLLITFAGGEGWRLTLPLRSGSGLVVRWRDRTAVGRATVTRFHGVTHVALPAALLPTQADVFVKLERRFGFFDEAGWRLVLSRLAIGRRDMPAALTPARITRVAAIR
jgi:LmbE family N-acetylglucosaminyl deacetylase